MTYSSLLLWEPDNVRFAIIIKATWVEIWRDSIVRAAINQRNEVVLGFLDFKVIRTAKKNHVKRELQSKLAYGKRLHGIKPLLRGMTEFYGEQG